MGAQFRASIDAGRESFAARTDLAFLSLFFATEQEEEREKMRQGVRDKYGIKKKEEKEEEARKQKELLMGGPATADSSLNRQKKTPEEIAAEANQDEFTSKCACPTRDTRTKPMIGCSSFFRTQRLIDILSPPGHPSRPIRTPQRAQIHN